MATPLMKEYCDVIATLREEFHEEVIVFMQVGSFYEIYEVEGVGHARLVASITGITLTKKNSKLPPSRENPWMCGFPLYTIGKFITRLNDEGYTVAVYDQKAENAKERFRRGVYTSSLRIDLEEVVESDKRLFSVLLEAYTLPDRVRTQRFLFSIVYVDVDTGVMGMKEFDAEDPSTGFHAFVTQFQPSEIVYHSLGRVEQPIVEEGCVLHSIAHKSSEGYMREAFEIPPSLSAEESLGLERYPNVVVALCNLLEFIHRHDPCLMSKLIPPVWSDQGLTLMEYNRDAFLELNIMDICHRRRSYVDKKKQKTLFDILNTMVTAMGRRQLRDRLRFPIVDASALRERFQSLEAMSPLLSHYEEIRESLCQLPDLDWLLLRWKRKKASMRSIADMLLSLQQFVLGWKHPEGMVDLDALRAMIADVGSHWDLNLMRQECTAALRHPSPELQREMAVMEGLQQELRAVENSLNYTNEAAFRLVKIDNLYYFQTTKKRWESVRNSPLFHTFKVLPGSSNCRIYSESLHTLSRKMKFLEDTMARLLLLEFEQQSDRFLAKHAFHDFSKSLGDLDYHLSLLSFFRKHHYTQPQVVDRDMSFLEVKNLRHAIIEHIDPDRLFVPHDTSLGKTNTGMLIYGINSSGKSTYLKSVGIALWLTQCGMYVPAESLELCPFHCFMSKIGAFDNLYMGHSTFVAEMSELHYIFRKSQAKRTLVLCDELTAGTEVLSATGIVGSTIQYFSKHQICNLMTTHLHMLSKWEDLPTDIYHFAIQTEKCSSLLIRDLKIRYDRQLKEGPGPEAYGIEIADAMGLPKEFIRTAIQMRSKIHIDLKSRAVPKRSKYNKRLWMEKCIHCGRKDRLHTHHITPQNEFTTESIHKKDGLYNLVVLCEECHEALHHG